MQANILTDIICKLVKCCSTLISFLLCLEHVSVFYNHCIFLRWRIHVWLLRCFNKTGLVSEFHLPPSITSQIHLIGSCPTLLRYDPERNQSVRQHVNSKIRELWSVHATTHDGDWWCNQRSWTCDPMCPTFHPGLESI